MNVYRPIDPPAIYYIIMAYKGPLYSDDVKYKDTQKSDPNDLKKSKNIPILVGSGLSSYKLLRYTMSHHIPGACLIQAPRLQNDHHNI